MGSGKCVKDFGVKMGTNFATYMGLGMEASECKWDGVYLGNKFWYFFYWYSKSSHSYGG